MNNAEMQTQENRQNIQLGNNIFSGWNEFQAAGKMATTLAKSTIVPRDYHDNPGNCLIAIEMANRLGTSPMMVMQNLYVVNGRPAWSSQYIVAMINASRRYKTELQYEIKRDKQGNLVACRAFAYDYNDHKVEGPEITMEMAEKEGWTTKNGSKWRTMPEVMIRYRAASFFGRLNCPDMIMGIYSTDEAIEISEDGYKDISQAVENEILENANKQPIDIQVDESTGEVMNPEALPAQDVKPEKEPAPPEAFDPGF